METATQEVRLPLYFILCLFEFIAIRDTRARTQEAGRGVPVYLVAFDSYFLVL